MVIGTVEFRNLLVLQINLSTFHIRHLNARTDCVADVIECITSQLVPAGIVQAVPRFQIDIFLHHRVSAKGIERAFILGISQRQIVALLTQIGRPRLRSILILHKRTHVVHGRIRPVSIETQNRDGVRHALHALPGTHRFGIDIALQVRAFGVLLIQGRFLLIGQGELHRHVEGILAFQQGRAAVQFFQEQVCVIGGHLAVAVPVGPVQAGDGLPKACGILQEGLPVAGIQLAVAVEVASVQLGVRASGAHRPPSR